MTEPRLCQDMYHVWVTEKERPIDDALECFIVTDSIVRAMQIAEEHWAWHEGTEAECLKVKKIQKQIVLVE